MATEIVNSDQNDLIVGDCVVVEQGQYTNDEIEQAVVKVRTLCED